MPEVTIIIPNYNGRKFMDQCMNALAAQTYTDFAVLIVDNGSTDGSVEYLRQLEEESKGKDCPFPVYCIYLSDNTGFSGAVNVGITAADSRYVVLLNNDTEVRPDYLKELVRVLEEDKQKKLFAVSPRMIQMYHPELLDDAGDGYCLLGWAFQRGVGQPVTTPKFAGPTEVFSACAGAAIYRKEYLEAVCLPGEPLHYPELQGGSREARPYFDPLHFAYLEDLDLCFRARIHGWKAVYEPKSEVLHVGSGTSGSKYNSFKVRLAARNNVFLNYKNMPLLMLILNLPGILLGVLVKQLFFIRRGFGRDFFGGFIEGLKMLPQLKKHKTAFQFARLGNYISIEWKLLTDTFSYVQDVLRRKL